MSIDKNDDGGFSLTIDHSGGNDSPGDQGAVVLNLHDDEPEDNHSQPAPELQTLLQINIYRFIDNHFEYLLLKKIDDNDRFWLPVTEPVPGHQTVADVLKKAAQEQIGTSNFRRLSQEVYSYEWYSKGQRGRDTVFTAELDPKTNIAFDQHRFSAAEWQNADQAIENLKWNGNKQALRQLDQRLQDKFTREPEFFTAVAPPSQTGITKRLPDMPDHVAKPGEKSNEGNVMEWFL